MTKNNQWPGWKEVMRQRLEELEIQHSAAAENNTRRHCWYLISELHPSDEEYQKALDALIELDGHPSAKESLR